MGTRSLTHVQDEDGQTLVTMYRQFDGYPTGQGATIKDTLGPRTLVNGFSDPATQTNGMGCAAALLIHAMKTGRDGKAACGAAYIFAANSTDCGEEYTYTLGCTSDREFTLKVDAYNKQVYSGKLSDFDPEAVEAEVGA